MIILTDLLKSPFDEGAKITTFNLLSELELNSSNVVFSINGNMPTNVSRSYDFKCNKLLLNQNLYQEIFKNSSSIVLYIPESSLTVLTLVRAKLIEFFTSKKVVILSLQPRRYDIFKTFIIKVLQPDSVITLSKSHARYLKKVGIKNYVIPLGVNNNLYWPYSVEQKKTSEKNIHYVTTNLYSCT